MQTFLPLSNYSDSAKVLDRQRLGKQRVENLQIFRTLVGEAAGWRNHPAVKMWVGSEIGLWAYQEAICLEWTKRGYNDTCREKTTDLMLKYDWTKTTRIIPRWLGDERLHSSHRANLLRKDPVFYGNFGWEETPQEGYWWPV